MDNKPTVSVRYGDRDYKADYLEWYSKAKHTGLSSTPGWVIKIDNFFESNMDGELSQFYPLYAFTQSISSYKKAGAITQNPSNASLQLEKGLFVIPQEAAYTKLLDSQVKGAALKEVVIRKLQKSGTDIHIDNEFTYQNAHIDHLEMVNGSELAILFSYSKLKVLKNIWEENAKKGMLAYEVEMATGKVVLG